MGYRLRVIGCLFCLLALSALLILMLGLLLRNFLGVNARFDLNEKESFLFTAIIWIVVPLMGALPYLFTSSVTNFFGIRGREEAKAYIKHPLLKERLINATQAVLDSGKTIYEILGIDAMRFRACMLLFASVSDEPLFKKVVAQYGWH